MLRKIKLTLLCALFATNAFSATEHTFTMASSYDFTLPSNVPQVFNNMFFWTIDAKCTIISNNESNLLSFTVLRKSGALNDVALLQGDAMLLVVHPGDLMHITAASGGRVELTNHSDNTIKASCTSWK